MHGLIFETSVWLLAGSTRFLSSKNRSRGLVLGVEKYEVMQIAKLFTFPSYFQPHDVPFGQWFSIAVLHQARLSPIVERDLGCANQWLCSWWVPISEEMYYRHNHCHQCMTVCLPCIQSDNTKTIAYFMFRNRIWKSLDVIFMYSSQERWSTYGLIQVMNTFKPTHWESMQIFLRSPTWKSAPCGFIGVQRSLQLISIGIHFLSVLATREKRCFHSLLSYHKHTVQLLPQRGANERG